MTEPIRQATGRPAHWREAAPADLAAIGEIGAHIHPDLPERAEVLAEKMRLYPTGCRVLVSSDAIVGYGISHPWKLHQIPPLDDFLGELPIDADCLYLHDVAVRPGFRGGMLAAYITTIATLARARGTAALALVSVYGTTALWRRFGFKPQTGDARLKAQLASYGETAAYMICDLDHAKELQA